MQKQEVVIGGLLFLLSSVYLLSSIQLYSPFDKRDYVGYI